MEANRIAIAAIEPSKTNPRKHFDEAKLAELADSIRRHDVVQPILLRPNGAEGRYELVAGERRFRAAKLAGLTDIPATVRPLSDTDVLEIQVVENLQRADLHELEEAEGYEQLLKCKHSRGDRYTVEEIAAKVGKSRSYVFARLKLLALCPEGRKAFYAGELDASRALLIARIGHHDTQRQALKDVTRGRFHNDAPMSYREAHQHILNTYMLALKSAPFDITSPALLIKAGACGPCPKRTGNQADLFGDVKSADVCTDPKCFDDKRQAHFRVAAADLEAKGFEVIAGETAKKALPHWEHGHSGFKGGAYISLVGYEKFDGTTYAAGRSQKVSALFAKDFRPKKLQHPLTGEFLDVVSSQAIAAAARKRAKDAPERAASSGSRSSGPRVRAPSPEEILEDRVLIELFKKVPEQLGRRELQFLAEEALMSMDGPDVLANELAPRKDGKPHDYSSGDKAIKEALPKMQLGTLTRMIVALSIKQRCYDLKKLTEAASQYKVDVAKVKKAIADEAKAAETSAPKAKGKAKAAA